MSTLLRNLRSLDLDTCTRLNRFSERDFVRWLFASVSRLGDGMLWYVIMLALPLFLGMAGLAASLQMALAGLLGLGIYRSIKARTSRLRPFMVDPAILARVRPLDQYSFPSGHTLQAVSFTTVACAHFPELAWVLLPFTLLVAASRPILGLHYPSDVVVGAAIGWVVARLVLSIPL